MLRTETQALPASPSTATEHDDAWADQAPRDSLSLGQLFGAAAVAVLALASASILLL